MLVAILPLFRYLIYCVEYSIGYAMTYSLKWVQDSTHSRKKGHVIDVEFPAVVLANGHLPLNGKLHSTFGRFVGDDVHSKSLLAGTPHLRNQVTQPQGGQSLSHYFAKELTKQHQTGMWPLIIGSSLCHWCSTCWTTVAVALASSSLFSPSPQNTSLISQAAVTESIRKF